MHNQTRELLSQYFDSQAKLNNVDTSVVGGEKQFTVAPTPQQKLESKIQESSAFLSNVNIFGVDEQEGEKIGLDVAGPLAGRTDTDATGSAGRQTRDISSVERDKYRVEQTNYDTHISYAKLDQWAKFKDFQSRIANLITQRIALDRIMIGFNGTSVAATSNLTTNPLLQDVNKGWLQRYRDHAGGKRVMTTGTKTAGKVSIGATGDFKNLNALAFSVINEFLDPWYRKDPGLVCIMSSELYSDISLKKIDKQWDPTEELALEKILHGGSVAGVPVVVAPFVPAGTLFITHLKNLSIYYQNGKNRRTFVDNAKFNRLETYTSSNDGYVIEDYGFGGVVENITLV